MIDSPVRFIAMPRTTSSSGSRCVMKEAASSVFVLMRARAMPAWWRVEEKAPYTAISL